MQKTGKMHLAALVGLAVSVLWSGSALAQYKCVVGGRTVVQPEPCADPANYGKYRCFVDGQVVYSEVSCTKVKSKADIEREAAEAEQAEQAKRAAAAVKLEEADRRNFTRRISLAEHATARHLRDPDSARFSGSFVSWLAGVPVVCGLVSGRNGFGGYAQPARYFAIDDMVTIETPGGDSLFRQQWARYCAAK